MISLHLIFARKKDDLDLSNVIIFPMMIARDISLYLTKFTIIYFYCLSHFIVKMINIRFQRKAQLFLVSSSLQ